MCDRHLSAMTNAANTILKYRNMGATQEPGRERRERATGGREQQIGQACRARYITIVANNLPGLIIAVFRASDGGALQVRGGALKLGQSACAYYAYG